MKYSIWITFEGKTEKQLQDIITKYSNKYKAPLFFPHISLSFSFSGDPKVSVEIIRNILLAQKPFFVKVNEIDTTNLKQKQLFLTIEKSDHIKELNKNLLTAFLGSITKTDEFMPHISLIYAHNATNQNFSKEIKKEIIKDLAKQELPTEIIVNNISLIQFFSDVPEEWKEIEKIKLS